MLIPQYVYIYIIIYTYIYIHISLYGVTWCNQTLGRTSCQTLGKNRIHGAFGVQISPGNLGGCFGEASEL